MCVCPCCVSWPTSVCVINLVQPCTDDSTFDVMQNVTEVIGIKFGRIELPLPARSVDVIVAIWTLNSFFHRGTVEGFRDIVLERIKAKPVVWLPVEHNHLLFQPITQLYSALVVFIVSYCPNLVLYPGSNLN